jgi:hypothetical protein
MNNMKKARSIVMVLIVVLVLTICIEIIQQKSSAEATYTYENKIYGIKVQYPSDWSVQESASSGGLITIATFLSPTGNPFPTAVVTIYMDRLHNSTTNLNNYAHFVAFTDYKRYNSTYFRDFKLLKLSTNSTLAGKAACALIGTYDLTPSGLQKLMEIGTIIGDKAYSVQYIADVPKYFDYLPTVQKMIDSLVITKSAGTGMPDNGTEQCNDGLCYIDNCKPK